MQRLHKRGELHERKKILQLRKIKRDSYKVLRKYAASANFIRDMAEEIEKQENGSDTDDDTYFAKPSGAARDQTDSDYHFNKLLVKRNRETEQMRQQRHGSVVRPQITSTDMQSSHEIKGINSLIKDRSLYTTSSFTIETGTDQGSVESRRTEKKS